MEPLRRSTTPHRLELPGRTRFPAVVSPVVRTALHCYSYHGHADLEERAPCGDRAVQAHPLLPRSASRGGRHKARVFKAALGFHRANADDLISAIRSGIMLREAEYLGETAHGFLWRVDMVIVGPGGTATVRTGWIYEKGK
ncbi:MAG: DUF6883 domain-containing protein, partial [Geminicoccales bacterium]